LQFSIGCRPRVFWRGRLRFAAGLETQKQNYQSQERRQGSARCNLARGSDCLESRLRIAGLFSFSIEWPEIAGA
jgi:hypothetical protein